MTETEKKALALVNEVRVAKGFEPHLRLNRERYEDEALCRAIEQQEAFRQEVSDAVEGVYKDNPYEISCYCDDLKRFIIAKPDPLVEVIADYKRTKGGGEYATNKDMAAALRAALAARCLEIREKQP